MPKFNVNHHVWVKLTDHGREIHRQYWEPYSRGIYVAPRASADGWSRFQMHDVMRVFGPHMVMGGDLPFETEIILASDEPAIWGGVETPDDSEEAPDG